MKTILILFLFAELSFGLLGKVTLKEINNATTKIDKMDKSIHGELGVVKENQITLQNHVNMQSEVITQLQNTIDISNEMITQLRVELQNNVLANAEAWAGLNKSVKGGRDVYQVNKNDTKVIVVMMVLLFGFMTGLIGILIKMVTKRDDNKHELDLIKTKQEVELEKTKEHLANEIVAKEKYKNVVEKKFSVINGR